ncbi:sulfotransferase family protein [Halomonadaceae bacterium KBTZ08]
MKHFLVNRVITSWRPFYRRYPLNTQASVTSINDRNLVDFELGVFCSRIPKAANSAVVTNLAFLKFGEHLLDRDAKKCFKSPAELSRDEVQALDNLYKFSIGRNPYTRVLSAYLDKVERVTKKHRQYPSFPDFIRYLETKGLYSNAHWAPQTELLTLPAHHYHLLGRTEDLENTLSIVFSNLQPKYQLDAPITAKRQTMGASKRLSEYYSPDLADRVYRLYENDFETFDYPKELSLG